MLMSYVGALKSWVYGPILRLFGAGPMTLRLPALLAATGSVWLLYLLLRRIGGARAAIAGCVLLAADGVYLLTASFDWGPVAFQHLLLVGAGFCVVQFFQRGGHWALAGGAFLAGLALWDKALAVWLLSGMAIAGLLTFPRQIFGAISRRRLGIAAAAFVVGALPLMIYNAGHHWVTFRGNFKREPGGIKAKFPMLVATINGSGLFGWMTSEDWQTPNPHPPSGVLERASAEISTLAGHPRHNLLLYAVILALLVTPLARGTDLRAILFVLIVWAVAWVQMAITVNTGGSVHHTILLWPLPQMLVALAFAAASRRIGRAGIPALAAVTAAMALAGALVINEYHDVMLRFGGAQSWNEAIYALDRYVAATPAKSVLCLDWGIMDPLRLLGEGRYPLAMGNDQVTRPEMSADDRRIALAMIAEPKNLFVAHTKDFEFFPGGNAKLLAFAEQEGYRRDGLLLIGDSYGRKVFEVYRLVPR